MDKTKLIRLYKTLTKKEQKLLKKWIASPMHCQHPKVIQLFDFIQSRTVLSAVSLKKERAFKAVFKHEKYDVYQLNHIISYAYDVLLRFIDYLELVNDEKVALIYEVRALKKRNLSMTAFSSLERLELHQEQSTVYDQNFYLQAFQLEEERFELEGTTKRSAGNNLPILFEQLTNFYCIGLLKYACVATTHANVYKTNYDISLLEAVLAIAKDASSPTIRLYYWAYQALNDVQEETYYEQLKQHFYKFYTMLPNKEQADMLLLCINYVIKRFNMGELHFVEEAFDWYRFGLDNDLLIQKNRLSQYAYKNIVGIAIRLKAFDWVEVFIRDKTVFLAPEIQQNYKHYATAKWHFAQQQYDACKLLLIQVEYDDLFLNIDSKMMLLKIYYEQEEFDALDALLHSFGIFLQRKEVMSYHKKNYKNVIALTRKLYRTSNWNVHKIQALKQEVETIQPLTEKAWLLEKLIELQR